MLFTDENFKASETLYFPCFEVEMKKALLRLGDNNPECFSHLDFRRLCTPLQDFIDGNHENFDLLGRFPQEVWNDGRQWELHE